MQQKLKRKPQTYDRRICFQKGIRWACVLIIPSSWPYYDIQWMHVSIRNYIRRTRLSILGNPPWEAKQTGLDTPSRKCETFCQSALLYWIAIRHSLNLPATRLHKDNFWKPHIALYGIAITTKDILVGRTMERPVSAWDSLIAWAT